MARSQRIKMLEEEIERLKQEEKAEQEALRRRGFNGSVSIVDDGSTKVLTFVGGLIENVA